MVAYKNNDRKKWTRIWLILTSVFVVVLVGSLVFIRRLYNHHLTPVNNSDKTVILSVTQGASVHEIAADLQDKGLIHSTWSFEWYVRSKESRNKLQAGTYAFTSKQSVQDIVDTIVSGKVTTDLVTILPGQRLDQIKKSLIENSGFSDKEVERSLNPSLYSDNAALSDKPGSASLEGYLYPDSYQKTADTELKTIIESSLDEMEDILTPEIRTQFTKRGLSVHEAIILASIIDQEVNNPADKPIVSQVFQTRLAKNMNLGSDVTAFYSAVINNQSPSVSYDSPYNTRMHSGLPPGPIGNVTKQSIEAVAYPSGTDYLFFVAGDDGTTYFSHTLEEHEALTAQHCKKLCQ